MIGVMPLFGRKKGAPPPTEQAVITHLVLSDAQFGTEEERTAIHELEERISEAVAGIGGDHDGDEFGGGEAVLFTYGPDADRLLHAIQGCLAGFPIRPGGYAIKRYGPATDPNSKEERVGL
jgi:hypothetical protein